MTPGARPRSGALPARRRAPGRRLAALAALALAALGPGPPRPAPAVHSSAGPPLAIAPEDVQRYREAGEELTIIDLRPPEAFRQGRLPGSRSIPLAELRRRQAEVPRTGRVVLYAGTAEEAAAAYQALRDAGHRNVMVLAGGLPSWTRLGLPLDPAR
jgi:rhodanese-related sulfurtransferase